MHQGELNLELVAYFNQMIEMRKRMKEMSLKFICFEEFVQKNGTVYTKFSRRKYRQSEMGQCFMNAFHLADEKKLIYVEGFAIPGSFPFPFPMLHAWVVDQNGLILDPTWFGKSRRGTEYWGVPFKMEFVRKTIFARGSYGIIDNMEQRFPLLSGTVDENEWKVI